MTPDRAKASFTSGRDSATRSLTRQEMHQDAVMLTNTGLFWARRSARRAAL
jgi:hypothetical protein